MSSREVPATQSSQSVQPPESRRRWMPQIGLSTLLLLTVCAAVWCAVWIARGEVIRLQMSLMQTRYLSRELYVKDRTRLAIVKQDEPYYDENSWQVFVPSPGMKLGLATTNVANQSVAMAAAESSAELKPGMHTIEVTVDEVNGRWEIVVTVDMDTAMLVRKEKAWNPNRGSSGGGNFAEQTEIDPGKPAILMDRLFHSPSSSNLMGKHPSGNGILLWIE